VKSPEGKVCVSSNTGLPSSELLLAKESNLRERASERMSGVAYKDE
jgi:hypothetical protein